MAIVVNQGGGGGGGGGDFAIGAAHIAYDSFLLRDDVTLTADSEDADQEIENGASWTTYGGGWQVSATGDHTVTVGFATTRQGQCYALHKHNLSTLGITVKMQISNDGSNWTDVAGSEQTPASDITLFYVNDTAITSPFWRLFFSGHTSGTMRIAQIFIGPCFQVHQPPGLGWSPPNIALNDDFITSRADGGDFLGRSLIKRGSKTSFTMTPVVESFVRNTWLPFMRAAEEQPFYYSWDTVNFPLEVAYCYVDKKIDIPRHVTNRHFTVPLKFIALQT